ncbi:MULTISPECIES: CRISPR-associated protein Cas5 [Bacillus]|uniref:CRISPR-associated protein Cas5 n=1 Tax=Bacillus TaxID=1386 RepID=UPI002E1D5407|nr:CRISPR-associated protein Cas5 [Bacillus smithii]MED1455312.1 CRISPR-associated protein Cas5 [Bacillus smithii]
MKIITFHLKGKMAQFRRYYSNSSALSYSIPPRTTVVGIIAGLLGFERDSYYELFSLDRCKIAVGIRSRIKKNMQKLNLLMIKGPNDLNASQEHHSQTATELVIPEDIKSGAIDYQIWFHHEDNQLMERFSSLFSNVGYKSNGISLALGTAQNIGWLESTEILTGIEKNDVEREVPIQSVVPFKLVERLAFRDEKYWLLKEDIPFAFDHGRRLKKKGIVIINLEPGPIYAHVKRFVSLENGENIIWLE